MIKAVVICSGGLDSTTLLYKTLNDGMQVYPIAFNYGQRHVKELDSLRNVLKLLNMSPSIVDISSIGPILKSALTSDIEVPDGHYEEDSMKVTVVPNRNMIMISIAVGYAESIGADYVRFGVHSGDHAIYPDCRPEFLHSMKQVIKNSTYNSPILEAPFMGCRKEDIVIIGNILKVPFELTWSCYKGGEVHCGKCGTCIERKESFTKALVKDPTIYEE